MRNIDYFRNKKVTVVGLARSGLACAQLLSDLGAEVSVTDCSDTPAVRLNTVRLKEKNIRFESGKHTPEFIAGRDFIVISPGVTNTSLPVTWARELGIPVIAEIEVGWMVCPACVIAVTGSSGKTTVATLIGKVLEASGKRVFVCGNIGTPFCGEVAKIGPDDFVSLEVSSFQLETIRSFKPKIAVMLNFSRNHLDRHKDIEEYLNAKKRIFMNQGEDEFLVLNKQDPVLKGLAGEAKAKAVYFSETGQFNPNQAAVAAVSSILGINNNLCARVFADFKGLEHRLEYVTRVNNIIFINDSKATTVESAVWAIKNISSPVILIAGGRDKGVDYRGIIDVSRKKVKEVIVIGEARERIEDALRGALPLNDASTLEEAVRKAFHDAAPGDCVLLSPMCSSFDMFLDYEERGRVFKNAVYALAQK
jgi:UDP-N-acetylmuramoylalanine--D-glutamate ligase